MININSKNITESIQEEEFIRIVLQVSLVLIIASIILVSIMYFLNKRNNVKLKTEKRVSKIFEELLIQYINSNNYAALDIILSKLKSFTWNPVYKSILKKNISELNKLFKGDNKAAMETLYINLGFYDETIKKLNKNTWVAKIEALNELKEMKNENAREKIVKLTTDENHAVSILAMQALMNIDNNPFDFLHDFKRSLSYAQIMFISKKVSMMKEIDFKEIIGLLRHMDPSFVKLGILISQFLKFTEVSKELEHLLHHSNAEIQAEAFITLSALDEQKYYKTLNTYCEKAPIEMLNNISKKALTKYSKIPQSIYRMINNFKQLKFSDQNEHGLILNY